jgi:hypothetical protein
VGRSHRADRDSLGTVPERWLPRLLCPEAADFRYQGWDVLPCMGNEINVTGRNGHFGGADVLLDVHVRLRIIETTDSDEVLIIRIGEDESLPRLGTRPTDTFLNLIQLGIAQAHATILAVDPGPADGGSPGTGSVYSGHRSCDSRAGLPSAASYAVGSAFASGAPDTPVVGISLGYADAQPFRKGLRSQIGPKLSLRCATVPAKWGSLL